VLAKVLNVLFVCVALPVLLVAPGMALWRSILARYERARRYAADTLGPWTAAAAQVAASMLLTGWVGFVLGEVGIFSRYLLVAIMAAMSAAGLLAAGRKPRVKAGRRAKVKPAPRAPSWRDTVRRAWGDRGVAAGIKGVVNDLVLRNEWFYAPVLLAVAAFLFMSPMRTLWRNHEAGRHLACGIALAERGSFRLHDPIGPALHPKHTRDDGVDPSRPGATSRLAGASRLGDAYQVSPRDSETIYPAFLHFGATWIGIGHALLGR